MARNTNILISTMNDVPGYKIVAVIGLVRGITVRSRSVVGNFMGGIEAVFGGRNNTYVQLCEEAREEATDILIDHAAAMGADAVVGMRYDANEVMDGITEVLAYGTGVKLERI